MPYPRLERLDAEKKQRVFSVCCDQIARDGYAQTNVKAIARRLQVADGYIYYYFEGKTDLVRWVVDTSVDIWNEFFAQHIAPYVDGDLFLYYRVSLVGLVKFVRTHRSIFGLYTKLRREPRFPLAKYLRKRLSALDNSFDAAIRREIQNGGIRDDLKPEYVAMMFDVIRLRVAEAAFDPALDAIGISRADDKRVERFADEIVAAMRDGLMANRGRPKGNANGISAAKRRR